MADNERVRVRGVYSENTDYSDPVDVFEIDITASRTYHKQGRLTASTSSNPIWRTEESWTPKTIQLLNDGTGAALLTFKDTNNAGNTVFTLSSGGVLSLICSSLDTTVDVSLSTASGTAVVSYYISGS